MINLKYIVTGTGRCGTLFMANLLTSMGYPCTHEAIFTPYGIEKARKIIKEIEPAKSSEISRGENLSDYEIDIVAESSYMAAPFLDQFDAQVIHVVRNPTDVVASMISDDFNNFTNPFPTHFYEMPDHKKYEDFMYGHLEELWQEMPQIDRCCLFYVRWNQMIEKKSKNAIFHRIEDGPEKIKDLLGFTGECYDNKKCNSRPSSKWSISDIQTRNVRKELESIMERYNYKPRKIIY